MRKKTAAPKNRGPPRARAPLGWPGVAWEARRRCVWLQIRVALGRYVNNIRIPVIGMAVGS